MRLGTGRPQRRGGRVRAGQADDRVPGFEEVLDHRGPDESGGSGDEYAHG